MRESLKNKNERQLLDLQWLLLKPEWKEKPVSIREFCESSEYLNLKGKVRPKILEILESIFPCNEIDPFDFPYQEAVMAGAIGVGKSFVTSITMVYMIYLLGCLKDPQAYFNMTPGSAIQVMNMATTADQARKIIFSEIKARIDHSSWFLNRFPYNKEVQSELRFPNGIFIIPGNSTDTFFEGYNIFGGILDEADSHTKTPEKDFAEEGYNAIKERIKSRFGFGGLLMVIGSPKTTDGFIMTRIKEAEKEKKTFSIMVPYWESPSPNMKYSGRKFLFKYGNNEFEVPIEHKEEFDRHPDKAMRDIAAIPTFAAMPYFAWPNKVMEYSNKSREIVTAIPETPFFDDAFVCSDSIPRVIHIDLGINRKGGDRCGFAMGHINDWTEFEGNKLPKIKIDYMQSLEAPPGGEIEITNIRRMVYELRDRGFKIKKVTLDGWQSVETIQNLNKMGITCELLSIDRTTGPYEALKDCLYQKRLDYPDYQVFIKECIQLEIYNDKIDHPPKGSKDCADAVAGVVFNLVSEVKKYTPRAWFKPLFGQPRLTVKNDVLKN